MSGALGRSRYRNAVREGAGLVVVPEGEQAPSPLMRSESEQKSQLSPPWVLGLLGTICVAADRGIVPVPGPKQQLLLALLALQPGHTVSCDLLMDALWGDSPPVTAKTSLRGHVDRLRKLLSAVPPPMPRVLYRSHGYSLAVDAERIDAVRFQELLAAAAGAEPHEARERLRGALSLWRGEPYSGLDHDVLRIESE